MKSNHKGGGKQRKQVNMGQATTAFKEELEVLQTGQADDVGHNAAADQEPLQPGQIRWDEFLEFQRAVQLMGFMLTDLCNSLRCSQ